MKLYLLLLLPFLAACSILEPTFNQRKNYRPRIVFEQGPCFGQCPVFKMTVYDNGFVLFEGGNFSAKPGEWSKTLSRSAVDELLAKFDAADLNRLQNVYRSRVPDASSITITYIDKTGKQKSIVGKEERPEILIELEADLRSIARGPDWIQQSGPDGLPIGETPNNELLIQLAPNVNPEVWIVKYAKQRLRVKERVSPNQPYYIITFEPALATATELLEWIRQDLDVVSAQENRQRVQLRGN
ncbi:MAG: DUF6438 domain-containing protein [Saprospiraceae bacterium]